MGQREVLTVHAFSVLSWITLNKCTLLDEEVLQVARYYSKSRECRWETIKVFFMTIRKKSGVLRDLLLEKRTKKNNKKPTTSLISFCWVQHFCFSAFRPYFARCCIMHYCGKLCMFLAQIRLKWRGSGVIKRYVLQQWIKRGGTLKLNQSVLYQDL